MSLVYKNSLSIGCALFALGLTLFATAPAEARRAYPTARTYLGYEGSSYGYARGRVAYRGHKARGYAKLAPQVDTDGRAWSADFGDRQRSFVTTRAAKASVSKRQRAAATRSAALAGGAAASGSSSSIVNEARRWLGTNPTGMARLWCARFMNFVLERTGLRGTGSNMAKSFASYGQRVSGPQVGAIAVMSRRGGGHVGIVSGVDSSGNPIVVSGNHGGRVAESTYPRGRILAYVMPTS